MPCIIQPTYKSDIEHWRFFLEPLIPAELGLQCTGSTGRDTVSQYAMLELLVSKFEQEMCSGRKAY